MIIVDYDGSFGAVAGQPTTAGYRFDHETNICCLSGINAFTKMIESEI